MPNRFNEPRDRQVKDQYVSQYVPLPLEMFKQDLNMAQAQGEEGLKMQQAASDQYIPSLAIDNKLVKHKVDNYTAQMNQSLDQAGGDPRALRASAQNSISDFKNWTRFGEGATITSSYNAWNEGVKKIDESDLSATDKDAWKIQASKDYVSKGGALGGDPLNFYETYKEVDFNKEILDRIDQLEPEGLLTSKGGNFSELTREGEVGGFLQKIVNENTGVTWDRLEKSINGYLDTNTDLGDKWSLQYDVYSDLNQLPEGIESKEQYIAKEKEKIRDSFRSQEYQNRKYSQTLRNLPKETSGSGDKKTPPGGNAVSMYTKTVFEIPDTFPGATSIDDIRTANNAPKIAIKSTINDIFGKVNPAHNTPATKDALMKNFHESRSVANGGVRDYSDDPVLWNMTLVDIANGDQETLRNLTTKYKKIEQNGKVDWVKTSADDPEGVGLVNAPNLVDIQKKAQRQLNALKNQERVYLQLSRDLVTSGDMSPDEYNALSNHLTKKWNATSTRDMRYSDFMMGEGSKKDRNIGWDSSEASARIKELERLEDPDEEEVAELTELQKHVFENSYMNQPEDLINAFNIINTGRSVNKKLITPPTGRAYYDRRERGTSLDIDDWVEETYDGEKNYKAIQAQFNPFFIVDGDTDQSIGTEMKDNLYNEIKTTRDIFKDMSTFVGTAENGYKSIPVSEKLQDLYENRDESDDRDYKKFEDDFLKNNDLSLMAGKDLQGRPVGRIGTITFSFGEEGSRYYHKIFDGGLDQQAQVGSTVAGIMIQAKASVDNQFVYDKGITIINNQTLDEGTGKTITIGDDPQSFLVEPRKYGFNMESFAMPSEKGQKLLRDIESLNQIAKVNGQSSDKPFFVNLKGPDGTEVGVHYRVNEYDKAVAAIVSQYIY